MFNVSLSSSGSSKTLELQTVRFLTDRYIVQVQVGFDIEDHRSVLSIGAYPLRLAQEHTFRSMRYNRPSELLGSDPRLGHSSDSPRRWIRH
ncbi:MAG: hypothetical protein J07HQW2_00545 [Haloquadratum walsbyi J07HQW2]|uniref:Uncharacterized protein n=1 Tax=Haloquadratum walsbyi J07HQW2 TaxID=1238425 RepID=U1PP88_9EURY|nr:MAG: hypothetical protein J07HQW2_00545 [Haloquadratum walsbyi J07HQW2]